MAEPGTQEHQNHEMECYLAVQSRMENIGGRGGNIIPVKTRTALSSTLNKLSNSPAISFNATHTRSTLIADISLTVGGEDAGTFGQPNIEKILEKSQPSPFGKGNKTVMDLEYRNGREIVAKDINIREAHPYYSGSFYKLIEDQISQPLFVGKPVKIELYKLAVYGKGGHFDWHRDTTHGDDHHATVLVALNTEWKGGNFGLRHQENTVDVDLHAVAVMEAKEEDEDEEGQGGEESKRDKDEPSTESTLGFQIIAFYTDIEHKVEEITDGTRIVLQFDVNVKGFSDQLLKSNLVKDNKDDEQDKDDEDDEEDEEDEDDEDDDGLMGGYNNMLDTVKPLFPTAGKHDAILEELVEMITKKHASHEVDEVIFPLRHLYRMASIRPEYLKGVDGYLYEGLKKTFEVSLMPIVLVRQTDYEGSWARGDAFGAPFVSENSPESERPKKKAKVGMKSEIHVPAKYEVRRICRTEYIEHTGNEAQFGESRYFGGGMFITAKSTEK